MNIELLEQIKARILAEPDAFRMDTWSCGTAHCIAGWALVLNNLSIANPDDHAVNQRLTDGRRPIAVAATLLGLDGGEEGEWDETEAVRLFCTYAWPERFEDRYDESYDDGPDDLPSRRRARAEIAAERIDHFIATNGAE